MEVSSGDFFCGSAVFICGDFDLFAMFHFYLRYFGFICAKSILFALSPFYLRYNNHPQFPHKKKGQAPRLPVVLITSQPSETLDKHPQPKR
ncbi:hypothetical protein FIU87_03845 [Bacillus sp. THAF10]|nr:hypothetical protein FIU87_03845 [Bacillus sp. THAF10]